MNRHEAPDERKNNLGAFIVECGICGFIVRTDRDTALRVAMAHPESADFVGHVTQVRQVDGEDLTHAHDYDFMDDETK